MHGQGTGSKMLQLGARMLQLEIPHSAATETLCSHINLKKKKRKEIITVNLLPRKSGSWPVESLRCVHGCV